ncbi:leucyl aminopeptidase [Shewanella sp. JM162201]|uniref:Probable cytosol aminopeptidase n=1 Tax=Shewanella jiangmenensis TaxID=2837387 RepID=A0ABS5V2X2_9GAMM|nr:leucyl aminopeptidase [Shewanella jiangmenensis]MBT1444275.1 leucyl aminopeptidase [Shewanella jiangmenensis]
MLKTSKSPLALLFASLLSLPAMADKVSFSDELNASGETLVLFKVQNTDFPGARVLADGALTHLERAMQVNQFDGEEGKVLELLAPAGSQLNRILVLGLGDGKLTEGELNNLGGKLADRLVANKDSNITLVAEGTPDEANFAAAVAHGFDLKRYHFSRYIEPKKDERELRFALSDADAAAKAYQQRVGIEAGVVLARDLVNTPAGDMTPEDFADAAKQLKDLGVKVTVIDPKGIEKLGMGALMGVGKGSVRGPRLVVAHWEGAKGAPVALVGKGITFDSGGYNIKASGDSISHMKTDMAGAAAILGTVKAMAMQKAEVNLVAVLPLAENMVSGDALRPGDVVRTAEGLSVEVMNTDAEGRLILADGMWYARTQYKPKVLIDVATLTGSKVRALGREYAGLFSDDEALVSSLSAAGQTVGEKLWRLPLDKAYGDELKSNIADLKNTGAEGSAGASSAAMFLKRFSGDLPWAHIDIAGNAQAGSDSAISPAGASGYGVRLLSQWLMETQKAN